MASNSEPYTKYTWIVIPGPKRSRNARLHLHRYGLSVDAADAEELARFWAEVLGRDVIPGASPEFATLDPDGAAPRLSFHRVPEAAPS
ncbi:VOC family protein [Streptomyces griseochromogenes]|uniref:VOC family protein n=1 Tax=Streptomyces griseochromogenes TaxID=68214 RepID=UPI0037B9BDD6